MIYVLWFLALVILQFLVLPKGEVDGSWFLFGTDTTSHNAIVKTWFWDATKEFGYIPLWNHELRGGIPSVGSFLNTPFAIPTFLFGWLNFPAAQKLQFMFAFFMIGLGGTWMGRVEGLRPYYAVLLGTAICLCGHFMTLIYPGHMQKIATVTWTPWFFGSLFLAFNLTDSMLRVRGIALAGFFLGMTFLSGHPQISYGLIMAGALYVVFLSIDSSSRIHFHRQIVSYACIGIIAGFICAAQFLPGLEMKQISNRTEGLDFEEAIATSYPPSDLGEYFLPRHRGDSSRAGFGVYAGEWNERLISDYMGATLFFFLLIGVLGSLRSFRGRYWLFVSALSIIVGLGKFTPLYKFLYYFWPGMNAFRAPAIFMFVAAIGLARLAVFGWMMMLEKFDAKPKAMLRAFGIFSSISIFIYMISVHYVQIAERVMLDQNPAPNQNDALNMFWWTAMERSAIWATLGCLAPMLGYAIAGRQKYTAPVATALMLVFVSWDLSTANRNFHLKEPWNQYEQYINITELELAFLDEPKPIRVLDLDQPISIRQILHGRDSMLGYQPIYTYAWQQYIEGVDFNSLEGRTKLGINYEVLPLSKNEFDDDVDVLASIGGSHVIKHSEIVPPFAFIDIDSFTPLEWNIREPNFMSASLPGRAGGLRLVQIIAPGWSYRLLSESKPDPDWIPVEEVTAEFTTEILPSDTAIEFRYKPKSFRIGLLLTGFGFVLFLYVFLATFRKRSAEESIL